MTTLTKTDRIEVIHRALKETFAPKFKDWFDEMANLIQGKVREAHPKFFELYNDPDVRPYLSYIRASVYIVLDDGSEHTVRAPNFEAIAKLIDVDVDDAFNYGGPFNHEYLQVTHPAHGVSGYARFADSHPYMLQYRELLTQLKEAHALLVSTTYAYKQREKFEVDFPDLAKHLPPRVVTKALAIPVDNVMKKLQKLGIPPVVKSNIEAVEG